MKIFSTALFALVLAFASTLALAAYPDRPIRIIVPFPPGGGSDTLARTLQKKLQDRLGQPVIVENRGGAQGSVGTSYGIRQPADGYTITLIVHGAMAISPFIYGNVGYDVLKDFAPVARATEQAYVLVAKNDLPVSSLKQVEAFARSQPGKLTFGTSGTGPQLVGELFKLTTKTDLLHVPYKGAGPASLALLAGDIDLQLSNPTSVIPNIKAGKAKGIVVFGRERNPEIPDVPSALEAGYPLLSDIPEWYGFAVPAGTPPAIVNKLNADFVAVLSDPEIQKSIRSYGAIPSPSTPDEFAQQIRKDYERWGKVVKDAGVKAE